MLLVSRPSQARRPPRMAIYAGNLDWELGAPVERNIPQSHELKITAYPNPFNNQTKIEFDLPDNGKLDVKIFDIAGRLVKETQRTFLPKGAHHWNWDASNFPAGIYFVYGEFYNDGLISTQRIKLVNLK